MRLRKAILLTDLHTENKLSVECAIYIHIHIQGVTGGTDQTSGGCSLC
jgi:hypothetical protein